MTYPADLDIRVLEFGEWHLVEELYVREFDNGMPTSPAQSVFFGVFTDNQLIGFAHVELVFNINAFYLSPDCRRKGFIKALFDTVDRKLPKGYPIIAFAYKNIKNVLKSYRFRDLGETPLFRRDG